MLEIMYKTKNSDLTFLKDNHLSDLFSKCKSCHTDAAIGTTEKRITEENAFIMASFLRVPFYFHHNNNDYLEKI